MSSSTCNLVIRSPPPSSSLFHKHQAFLLPVLFLFNPQKMTVRAFQPPFAYCSSSTPPSSTTLSTTLLFNHVRTVCCRATITVTLQLLLAGIKYTYSSPVGERHLKPLPFFLGGVAYTAGAIIVDYRQQQQPGNRKYYSVITNRRKQAPVKVKAIG